MRVIFDIYSNNRLAMSKTHLYFINPIKAIFNDGRSALKS